MYSLVGEDMNLYTLFKGMREVANNERKKSQKISDQRHEAQEAQRNGSTKNETK